MKLLTGATGTAGSFIVNEFVRRQEPVRVLVRDRAKAAALERVPTVEIVEGDMSRGDTLGPALDGVDRVLMISAPRIDRKSTRLNSSHLGISYAVFCLKKKKIASTSPRPAGTWWNLKHI